jgi:hypothetical protein
MEELIKKEEQNAITLTEEEKNIVKAYQEILDKERLTFANLRMQYLASEKQLMTGIDKSQNDYVSHLKVLSKAKKIPTDGNWIFDPIACIFRKHK